MLWTLPAPGMSSRPVIIRICPPVQLVDYEETLQGQWLTSFPSVQGEQEQELGDALLC